MKAAWLIAAGERAVMAEGQWQAGSSTWGLLVVQREDEEMGGRGGLRRSHVRDAVRTVSNVVLRSAVLHVAFLSLLSANR